MFCQRCYNYYDYSPQLFFNGYKNKAFFNTTDEKYEFVPRKQKKEEGVMNQKYYEFVDNEYYGLVAVNTGGVVGYSNLFEATKIYLRDVGGESVQEILEEALPVERSRDYAFRKFMYGCKNMTVEEAIKDFEESKNSVLLVDSSLI